MKRKSVKNLLILSFVCLFLAGATASTCEAQWWFSTSSSSSSSSSSGSTWWYSTSSSSSSSSSGSIPGCPSGAICREDTPKSTSKSGPYGSSRTSDFPGFTASASIYIPQNAEPPFSALIFMQPFMGTQVANSDWGPFFASHGIVYVNCDSATTMDTVDLRASLQWSAYNALKKLNTRNGHALKGKLDTSRIGLLGWSMGGGATWINAAKTGPKTAMSLAGHNLSATSIYKSGRYTKCPMLLMNGATDLTFLGGMYQSESVYNAIPRGIPKALYVISIAGHFDWGGPDTVFAPNAGALALAFQKTYLDGDTRWKTYIKRPLDSLTWRSSDI